MAHLDPRALRIVVAVIAWLWVGAGLAGPVSAQTGNSSAFGESVNLTVVPLLGSSAGVTSGPRPISSGSAPPAYSDSDSETSQNVSQPSVGTVMSTGLLVTNAQSPTLPTPTADATVNNLGGAGLNALFTVGASRVRSTAAVTGPCGHLTAAGTTTIENGTFGGPLGSGVTTGANPPPNTVLMDVQVGGLATQRMRVVLNEQILGGDGVISRSITVNAIHISYTNAAVVGVGAVSGDVIVSQSRAEMTCGLGSANLSITKVDSPDPVAPGQPLTYLITVANQGPNAAPNVTVTDTLPLSANVTFGSATPSQGSCGGPNPLVCNLGVIGPGASATITIVLNVGAGATGSLSNTATVSSDVPDPDTSNNTVTAGTTVAAGPSASADLGITMTDSPDPVVPGSTLTYVITVTNSGPDPATGVTVTDSLPLSASVTFGSATPSQGSCGAPNPLVCNLGTLAPGASATITLTVNVGAGAPSTLTSTATAASGVADPNTSNNTATATTAVGSAPGGSADLTISKVASPSPAVAGQPLTYLVTVTNQGPNVAPSVTVTDSLPLSANVSFGSATPSQGSCGAPNPLVCNLGPLGVGGSATISVVLNLGASASGTLTNSASVTGGVPDPAPSSNTVTTLTPVAPAAGGAGANLSVTMTDSPDPVAAGGTLTYVITVTNQGPDPATGVTLTDTLPLSGAVTFGSATPSQGSCGAPNPLVCTLGTLAPGASATVTVTVNVGAGATSPIVSSATGTSAVFDPDTSNNTATASTLVSGAAAAPIPTLSEWAFITMTAILAVGGYAVLRRRTRAAR